MPGLHSSRSPSGAHRWMRCLGSPQAEAGLPEKTSEWADQGTFFHEQAAACLMMGLEASWCIGSKRTINGVEYVFDEEMAGHLQPGLDWIRDQPGRMIVERRVSLGAFLPGESGTVDCGIVSAWRGRVTVFDWKYGAGELVVAERNEQIMLYALGLLEELPKAEFDRIDDVRCVIWQPRIPGGVQIWDTTVSDIYRFAYEAARLHEQTFGKDPPREAGKKQCRWCKAISTCGEHARFNLSVVSKKLRDLDNGGLSTAPAGTFTPERRAYVLKHWPMLERWHKALHADALNDALKGRPTPGQKAVDGKKGVREWSDPTVAEEVLAELLDVDEYKPRELISPAQAEKTLTKLEWLGIIEDCPEIVMQKRGKPILVDADDVRPAIKDFASKFETLEVDNAE